MWRKAEKVMEKSIKEYWSLAFCQMSALVQKTANAVSLQAACLKDMQVPLLWSPDKGIVERDFLLSLKVQCDEVFCFWFFHESVSPQPQSIPLGPFQIFRKFAGYSQVKVHHRFQWHQRQICHRYQLHRRQIFPPVSLVLLIPVANLPPVSTIPVANNGRNIRLLRP